MKWFRFYDEVLDDPKCQRLTPIMFRHWVNVLCIANRSSDRGVLPDISDVAFGLRLSPGKTKSVLNDLVKAGLLDRNEDETFSPHGWSQRQRVSDDVAKRVAKHRGETVTETESQQESNVTGNVTETFPHVRATEAETETDTPCSPPTGDEVPSNVVQVSAPRRDLLDERWQRFWAAYPRHEGTGAARKAFGRIKPDDALLSVMLASLEAAKQTEQWRRDNGQFIPHASTWLNQQRWEDEVSASVTGPEGIALLPGETANEVAPGHWELVGTDGFKRVVKPDFYGVIYDQRVHRHEGLQDFYQAVADAKSAHARHQEAA